jgi:hypothetical protein
MMARRLLFAGILFLLIPRILPAEPQWYFSNISGMALRPGFSRLALQSEYALSIDHVSISYLPFILLDFFYTTYEIELRILYKNGVETRKQWRFIDEAGRIRVVAAFVSEAAERDEGTSPPKGAVLEETDNEGEADAEKEGDEGEKISVDYTGFIELYNEEEFITEEHQYSSDGTDRIIQYSYNRGTLVSANTRIKHPATETEEEYLENYCTDHYRYSRSSSLRGVERVYHGKGGPEHARTRFPHIVLAAARENKFVKPPATFFTEFFEDVLLESGHRVVYTTDDRGRVISETRRDENGELIGELRNTWSGDRLVSIHWVSEEGDRRIEFEYNSKNERILERNFNAKGELERLVRTDGEREVEELYMHGLIILRAVWVQGRKISEERIHPPRENPHPEEALSGSGAEASGAGEGAR